MRQSSIGFAFLALALGTLLECGGENQSDSDAGSDGKIHMRFGRLGLEECGT